MGRPKKTPETSLRYHNIGFYQAELDLIRRCMEETGVSLGAAVRILVRRGAHGPATSPFTPVEGPDDEQ